MSNHPNRAGVVIIKTRQFYGPREQRSLVRDEEGRGLRFRNRAEAQAWLDEEVGHIYYLSHGEVTRPEYEIRLISRLPEFLTWQL